MKILKTNVNHWWWNSHPLLFEAKTSNWPDMCPFAPLPPELVKSQASRELKFAYAPERHVFCCKIFCKIHLL